MLGLVVLGQTPKSAQVLKAILSPSHNRPLDGYCAVPSLLAKFSWFGSCPAHTGQGLTCSVLCLASHQAVTACGWLLQVIEREK